MTNWSVILNVLLLIGVIFAILRMVQAKHSEKTRQQRYRAEPFKAEIQQDDIIAVRKLNAEDAPSIGISEENREISSPSIDTADAPSDEVVVETPDARSKPVSLMMFLLAKDNKQLAGYELLQTILAAGLRFGDGQLFHRHQLSNGQGPIICSLATATESGVFDLQNMGAFSVRGLCLFMEASGNASIDAERLTIMVDTAKQLSDGLETYLLDDERAPWSDRSLMRYQALLGITEESAAYLD